jgi:hypothetical protein
MSLLQKLSDPRRPGSIARRLRERRFAFFSALLENVPRPIRLLDIGGTVDFWETMGFLGGGDTEITLCNVTSLPPPRNPGIRLVQADACDLGMFRDGEYDVVFSNSVIEHVGDMSRCRAMADEVQRVGRRYFVQTPNRHFPIDPHFPFPFFQFLPLAVRAFLLRKLPLAWVGRIRDPANAREIAQSVKLLTESELRGLFPGCEMYREKFLGMTKSFIAYSGWSPADSTSSAKRASVP